MNSANPVRRAVAPAFLRAGGMQSLPACALAGGLLALLVFVVCAIAVYHRTGILAFNSDDSYIYTGYVKMTFTPGAGLFSYNVGEHSAGTTGILFYYLLALSYRLLTVALPSQPSTLVLNSWIVSGICFTLCGAVSGAAIATVCRQLKIAASWIVASLLLLGTGMLCTSDNFLWGQLGGMENPLSALLAMSLSAITVAQRPNLVLASALAAGLVATRPDWAPIALAVPALSLARTSLPLGRRWRDLLLGYAVFVLLLAAALLPLRMTTGQWQPSALGARVELHWIESPGELGLAMKEVFVNGWGQAIAVSWIACVLFHHSVRSHRAVFFIPLFITLFFLMRAASGLENFNVRDRYVSYLWPPLAMTFVLAIVAVFHGWLTDASRRKAKRITAAALIAIGLGSAAFAAWSAVNIISRDTLEMLQVHVRPSQWMKENLPAHAIVEMEPAGAIRTFTDFVLVDRTGLTTGHVRDYLKLTGKRPEEDFRGFLEANRVEFLFDYSRRGMFDGNTDVFHILQIWTPTPRIHSLGRIALVRVVLPRRSNGG